MEIPWNRADLSAWGEFVRTPYGIYRKFWKYVDEAQNNDGCLFELQFEGETIAKDIDGPTITDAEDAVDVLVINHMREMKAAQESEATS